jgi:ribosomal-protein-alanine N-acetyltransferase
MSAHYAEQVARWQYPEPYGRYGGTGDVSSLVAPDNGYHAVLEHHELVAFRCFGAEGQVPGGDYSADALDTGGGLRPDLTGQGLGRSVIAAGLDFGRSRFAPAAFRVTVAGFNTRALSTVRALGFVEHHRFASTADGDEYVVLVRRPA